MGETDRSRVPGAGPAQGGKGTLAALRDLSGRARLASRLPLPKGTSGEGPISWLKAGIQRVPIALRLLLLAAATGLVVLVLSPGVRFVPASYRPGEIATEDIRARYTFEVQDEAATQKKRDDAAAAVLPVYDLDEDWLSEAADRVRESFGAMRAPDGSEPASAAGEGPAPARSPSPSAGSGAGPPPETRESFERILGTPLSELEFAALAKRGFDEAIEESLVALLASLRDEYVIADSRSLRWGREKGIHVRGLPSRREEEVRDLGRILKLAEAEDLLAERSRGPFARFPSGLRAHLTRVAQRLVSPNLSFNKAETEERRAAAVGAVGPVYFRVQKGETIIRAGDPVQPVHIAKMEAMRSRAGRGGHALAAAGLLGVTLLLLAMAVGFSAGNLKEVDPTGKDLLFLAGLLVGEIAFLKLSLFIASSLRLSFSLIPLVAYTYAFPFAVGPMLVRLVLNAEAALVFAAVLAPLAGIAMDSSLAVLVVVLLGSMVGIQGVARCDRRMTILKAGLGVGGMNCLLALFFALLGGGTWSPGALRDLSFEVMGGLAGGVAVAVLVAGLTPIVESLFRYTTDIRLLELANLDHPLLKEVTLKAPGTYHHSVVIGSMVETAAKAIGANALLARVAAYYHDIGKLSKPHYFIENQESGENPHDRLSPAMSTLILLNHVKEGVDLARRHRLGERIADMIRQSHGTALTDYFYEKAKNQASADQPPDETYFRYPGPKPQTREAGLLMLADSVEAASRTLTDWSPARIQGLVQKTVNRKFSDGQLDECEMTLKDLNAIAKSFTKSLAAVYRRRIDYPEPAYKLDTGRRKTAGGPAAAREPKRGQGRAGRGGKGGPDDLRRLGMS